MVMSARALMIGTPIASMSQLRAAAARVSNTTATTTTTLDSAAPIQETSSNDHKLIVGTPKAAALARANSASSPAVIEVRRPAAARFCMRNESAAQLLSYWPVSMPVPSRAPSAPKTAPRMPMAAGTSTSRPGSRSRSDSMAPSTTPATTVIATRNASAVSPCRTVWRSRRQWANTALTSAGSGNRWTRRADEDTAAEFS